MSDLIMWMGNHPMFSVITATIVVLVVGNLHYWWDLIDHWWNGEE
jgi:hypothetical protein